MCDILNMLLMTEVSNAGSFCYHSLDGHLLNIYDQSRSSGLLDMSRLLSELKILQVLD